MSWLRWFTKTHHGKERVVSGSDGSSKTEVYSGKRGEGFSSHVSVRTKPDGSKSAHAGPHRDKARE